MAEMTLLAILLCDCSIVSGFTSTGTRKYPQSTITRYTNKIKPINSSSLSPLYAGFGGGGTTSSKKKKGKSTETKLKPKQQWDRYVELKDEPATAVGVRVEGTDEWLDVGDVKSREAEDTPRAVFRQRALIGEHARRLHPGPLASKPKIQWGYRVAPAEGEGEGEEGRWAAVDGSCVEDVDDADQGLPKRVGFRGRPDPATGSYVDIAGGRIDASALGRNTGGGGGGPITGSKREGKGDGVV